jgi:hypothetical protein
VTAPSPDLPVFVPTDQEVSGTAGHVPRLRPGSVRRTTSVDMTWTNDGELLQHLHGRARDLLVPADGGEPVVLGEATVDATADFTRVIRAISADPHRDGLDGLVGARGGSQLRGAIDEVLPGERQAGTPLHILLDDLAGCSLIAPFVWTRFMPELLHERGGDADAFRKRMEGVCFGFAPGSSSLTREPGAGEYVQVVTSLVHPDEPGGWHGFPDSPERSMRRARRIDLWIDGDDLRVDSSFQDSSGDPEYGRVAVHEYGLAATADLATATLRSVTADPRVLPFVECPHAVDNLRLVLGLPLPELRTRVPDLLGKTMGCTHLNDALRALSEVPVLARALTTRG